MNATLKTEYAKTTYERCVEAYGADSPEAKATLADYEAAKVALEQAQDAELRRSVAAYGKFQMLEADGRYQEAAELRRSEVRRGNDVAKKWGM